MSEITTLTSYLKNAVLARNHTPSPKASTVHCQRCGRRRIPPASQCVNFGISWVASILQDAWLKLTFYRPLCYNSRTHCSLLQCLRTSSAILAGAHSYFVLSSFKWEGKNRCHDFIPNTHIWSNIEQNLYMPLKYIKLAQCFACTPGISF